MTHTTFLQIHNTDFGLNDRVRNSSSPIMILCISLMNVIPNRIKLFYLILPKPSTWSPSKDLNYSITASQILFFTGSQVFLHKGPNVSYKTVLPLTLILFLPVSYRHCPWPIPVPIVCQRSSFTHI